MTFAITHPRTHAERLSRDTRPLRCDARTRRGTRCTREARDWRPTPDGCVWAVCRQHGRVETFMPFVED